MKEKLTFILNFKISFYKIIKLIHIKKLFKNN